MTTERTHTPGPWYIASDPYAKEAYAITVTSPGIHSHIANIFGGRLCAEHGGSAYANARLIALAPTAPHECAPDCPGEINRRKLAAHDALVTALEVMLEAFTTVEYAEAQYPDDFRTAKEALALVRGDA